MGWASGMCLPRGAEEICLVKYDVAQGAGAPNQLLAPRADALQNAPASYRGRRCEPKIMPTTKNAIGRSIGATGEDALIKDKKKRSSPT
jgi:hypothetical protein